MPAAQVRTVFMSHKQSTHQAPWGQRSRSVGSQHPLPSSEDVGTLLPSGSGTWYRRLSDYVRLKSTDVTKFSFLNSGLLLLLLPRGRGKGAVWYFRETYVPFQLHLVHKI